MAFKRSPSLSKPQRYRGISDRWWLNVGFHLHDGFVFGLGPYCSEKTGEKNTVFCDQNRGGDLAAKRQFGTYQPCFCPSKCP